LLGSRSGSAAAACAGGAKPDESGVLLAQPVRSAPARMTAPARSSISQPLFVPVKSYGRSHSARLEPYLREDTWQVQKPSSASVAVDEKARFSRDCGENAMCDLG
jgi:hypothetical protein